MIQAILFDLYGTLIRVDRETRPYLRFAHWVQPEDPRDLVRRSLLIETRGISHFATLLGIGQSAEALKFDEDLQHDLLTTRLFEDVLDVLAASGLRLGLISNVASPYKEPFYRLHLDRYFNEVFFSCEHGLCKPDPEVYLRMGRRLETRPDEMLMIGDRLRSDDHGPTEVGMKAVLLQRRGQGPPGVRWIGCLRELAAEIKP